MQIPAYLKPGDTIGITCPAGALSLETIQPMLDQLITWGFQIKIGRTVGTSYQKYSATDKERVSDLQQMLDDNSISAILFGRGGYGVVRIIDQLDFTQFAKHPKWLVGYSDITCFHSHLHTQYQIATMHAHMSGGYLPNDRDDASTQSILDCLLGNRIDYSVNGHEMNREGEASGQLIGGNLALLSDLIGTPSDIDTRGKILVIEDIGEYKYNIDRMLWQLKRSGKFDHLAGLIVGGFTDTMDNDVPFGMTEYEIVWEKVKEFNYPVCFDFPVGHQARNLCLKMGETYSLIVKKSKVHLQETSQGI